MVGKASRPSKRSARIATFGVAIVASLALAAFAATGASALSFVPANGTYPMRFAQSSGAIKITSSAGTSSCTSSTGAGEITNATTGNASLTLKGCTSSGIACTSSGQSAGTIVTSPLSLQVIYLDAAHTKFGWLLSPTSGEVFAEFNCWFGKDVWTGSLIGQVTNPALNTWATSQEVVFAESSTGVQKYQQIEGAGAIHRLSESFNGGAARSVALTFLDSVTNVENGKYLP